MSILRDLAEIVGHQHVLTGPQARPYGHGVTGQYVAEPGAVVRPASTAEISAVLALACKTGTPVIPIAGNTGVVGGTYAPGRIMLSVERLNTIREIRPDARIAIVEAGTVLSSVHDAAAPHGLAFPLTFGARGSAMIGGCLATNAGGSNVLRHGNVRALCLGLEAVLADGRIVNLMGQLHKDNSGYDLRDLLIGSEGTLGIITAAVLKLVPAPRAWATAMVAAASLPAALDLLNRLQEASGGMVEAFEYMPRNYMRHMKRLRPDLHPPLGHDRDITLLVELGAVAPRDAAPQPDGSVPVVELLQAEINTQMEAGLALDAVIATSEAQRREFWKMREIAAELAHSAERLVESDIALPLDRIEEFLTHATARLAKIDPEADTSVVGHLGDGNLHYTVWPSAQAPGIHDAIAEMVEQEVLRLGGSFSAEHGVGISKLASMSRCKDPVALDMMRAIKAALDPQNILNPGKVIPPG